MKVLSLTYTIRPVIKSHGPRLFHRIGETRRKQRRDWQRRKIHSNHGLGCLRVEMLAFKRECASVLMRPRYLKVLGRWA